MFAKLIARINLFINKCKSCKEIFFTRNLLEYKQEEPRTTIYRNNCCDCQGNEQNKNSIIEVYKTDKVPIPRPPYGPQLKKPWYIGFYPFA